MKPKKGVLTTAALVVVICVVLLTSGPLRADGNELFQLRQRVTELEARIKDLEARLQECLKFNVNDGIPDAGWRNTKNWRKLEIGMEKEKVKSILGEPVKVIQGFRTLWYYPNFYCGYVSFDEKEQVAGWSEP